MSDDLSHLSDDELLRIASAPEQDLSKVSEAELLAAAGVSPTQWYEKAPAEVLYELGEPVRGATAAVGRFIDRYTGSPTRAAMGAAQSGKNPVGAFWDQFGRDPELAPTGKDIAKRTGFSEKSLSDVLPGVFSETGTEWNKLKKGGLADVSPAGVAGLGYDVALDWTNAIPPALLASEAAKSARGAGKVLAKSAAGAADLATGTEVGTKAAKTVEESGKAVSDVVNHVVNPKVAETYPEMVAIAKKNGIPPEALSESIEFGPRSFISRATRAAAEGPAGEALLERHNRGVQLINQAVGRKLEAVAGGKLPADAAEAGAVVRSAHEAAMDKFFDGIDLTYDTVQKYAPGMYLEREAAAELAAKTRGIERQAKGFINRGDDFQRSYGQQLLRLVNSVRESKNFKQINELRQWIGKNSYAKDSRGLIRELYQSINDALEKTVRTHMGDDFANEILQNNKSMTNFYRENSKIIDVIDSKKIADEGVFSRIFSNTQQVDSLKKILSPEQFQQLKGAYLNSLIRYNAAGGIEFGSTLNNFRRYAPVMKKVFTTEDLVDIAGLVKLGHEYGPQILSSSGTGASNAFRELKHGISEGLINRGVVDKLKERARAAATAAPVAPKPPGMPAALSKAAVDAGERGAMDPELAQYAARFLGYRENPTAQRAKLAQIYSASQNEERKKRRLRALGE